ncbi:MAG: HNH endonuclease [Bacteroidia bacterium]|jgi:hypothetical protein|nr:HNH endonuclease [Bacteroidia bacterium]
MGRCYICETELLEKSPTHEGNKSIEHILLNSIGGKLKSRELICKKCNSEMGHGADQELAHQLAFLATFLAVERDDKEPNKIIKGAKTANGEEYNIGLRGKPIPAKPTHKVTPGDKGTDLHFTARSEEELTKNLKGLEKKYPGFSVDEAKKHFKWTEKYLNEQVSIPITIGGEPAFQSIAKSAVNFYMLNNGEREQIKHLIPYLKGKETLDVVQHYHVSGAYEMDENEVLHLLHLVGNAEDKILYCFVEFFSSYSFIVLLSENYSGDSFTETYSYDVIKGEKVDKTVQLDLNKAQLKEIFDNKTDYRGSVSEKGGRVIQIGNKIAWDLELERITKNVWDKVFSTVPEGTIITEDMVQRLCIELAEKYVEFINRSNK